jgi:hypothetical protein
VIRRRQNILAKANENKDMDERSVFFLKKKEAKK